MKSMKNNKPKIMSTYIYTIYNNGSFVINFIKFFMHYILRIFSYFLLSFFGFFFFFFGAILTLFNFSSSSTIVFLVQSFIPTIIFFFPVLIWFSFVFNFFFLYIFLDSTVFTLFNLSSTSTLLLFHLNFRINFFLLHFHVSPLFLPSYPRQKGRHGKMGGSG